MKKNIKGMRLSHLVIISFFMTILSFNTKAQNQDSTDFAECMGYLSTLQESYSGKTSGGNDYVIYAFQYASDWAFIIRNTTGLYGFLQKGKEKEPHEVSAFFIGGICEIVKNNHLKLVEKKKLIQDLNLESFYQFSKDGKLIFDAFWFVETQEKKKGRMGETVAFIGSPVVSMLKGKTEALQQQIQSYKDQIVEYQQQITDYKTKVTDMQAQLESCEEMTAKLADTQKQLADLKQKQQDALESLAAEKAKLGEAASSTLDKVKPAENLEEELKDKIEENVKNNQ